MERAEDKNRDEDLPLPGTEESAQTDKDAEQGADENVSVGYGAGDTAGQEGIQDSLANEEEEISGSSGKTASRKQEPEE